MAKDICDALGYTANRLNPARKRVNRANVMYFIIHNDVACSRVSALNMNGVTEFLDRCRKPGTMKCAKFISENIMKQKFPILMPEELACEHCADYTENHTEKRAENHLQNSRAGQSYIAEPSMQTVSTVARHKAICTELSELYERKNNDYGDAFHLSFTEEGMAMARIRLGDKLNRFKTLTKDPNIQNVMDESVRDTLMDLANYAIMTVMEMDRKD